MSQGAADELDDVRGYFDQASEDWDGHPTADPGSLSWVVDKAGLGPGDDVLDVGTGTGILIPLLGERIGRRGTIYALDLSSAMLDKVRAKDFRGVTCICAPAENIPLPDGACRAVVCFSAFPHFVDKARAMAEMARVLSPGGRLVIAHAESREALNAFHAGLGGVVGSHRLPDEETMRGYAAAAALDVLILGDGPDGYVLVAARSGP